MRTSVLELLWQGAIRPMHGTEANRLKRVLQAMLPMRIICLAASTGIDRISVLPDEIEVMPALPLGDVVVEELSVDVPYGALLMFCDDDVIAGPIENATLSYDLGIAVGQTLLTVLRRGTFPLERENEALYIMACAFDRMAHTTGMQHLGLVPGEFSKGLAGILGAYWSGSRLSRTEQSGLFLGTHCLASSGLRQYLTSLDAGFNAPEYNRIPRGLLAFSGGTYNFGDWLELVDQAVSGVMSQRKTRLING